MAKKNARVNRACWLAPLAVALPVLAGLAAVLLLWGEDIRDLINIAVKLVVIS